MVRSTLAALGAAVAMAGCYEEATEQSPSGKPLHAPASFDPSLPGWVACSTFIVEGNVVSVSDASSGGRMIIELEVDRWIKPASGPKIASIEMADIAAEGVYERWEVGTHLFLQVDVDPAALPNWQFRERTIKKIERALPESRTLECPYGPT